MRKPAGKSRFIFIQECGNPAPNLSGLSDARSRVVGAGSSSANLVLLASSRLPPENCGFHAAWCERPASSAVRQAVATPRRSGLSASETWGGDSEGATIGGAKLVG